MTACISFFGAVVASSAIGYGSGSLLLGVGAAAAGLCEKGRDELDVINVLRQLMDELDRANARLSSQKPPEPKE